MLDLMHGTGRITEAERIAAASAPIRVSRGASSPGAGWFADWVLPFERTLLRTTVAGPLGADVHIGLPAAEHRRVAEFRFPAIPPRDDLDTLSRDGLMRWNAYANPPGVCGAGWVNTAAWRRVEMPSTNGHGRLNR